MMNEPIARLIISDKNEPTPITMVMRRDYYDNLINKTQEEIDNEAWDITEIVMEGLFHDQE